MKETMITILRKPGFILNPNDKIVNAIIKRVIKNDGNCPCHNNAEDPKCPCSNYRINDNCQCGLYIKE